MYQKPTVPAKSLAQIQAEERNLNNLKNLNVPWVFIQPTRLKKVRIPHSRPKYKNQETFEKLGADDLAFLGNADIDLSESDIKTLVASVKGGTDTSYLNEKEFSYDDIEAETEEEEIQKPVVPKRKSPVKLAEEIAKIEETPRKEEDIIKDDDYDLLSSRSDDDMAANLFAEDQPEDDFETARSRIAEVQNDDSGTVKNLIMDNIRVSSEEKEDEKKIKLFTFSESPSKETERKRAHSANCMAPGRKKLIGILESMSKISKEESAISKAENYYKDELDQARERIRSLKVVEGFKNFCQENYGTVPEVLVGNGKKPKILKPKPRKPKY